MQFIRSISVMTETGLNLSGCSISGETANSQLVSNMYSAVISFFEFEIGKGEVQQMEFTNAQLYFYKWYNLYILVEFPNFLDEHVADYLVEVIVAKIKKHVPNEFSNHNKYIPILKAMNMERFLDIDWQIEELDNADYIDLWEYTDFFISDIHAMSRTIPQEIRNYVSSFEVSDGASLPVIIDRDILLLGNTVPVIVLISEKPVFLFVKSSKISTFELHEEILYRHLKYKVEHEEKLKQFAIYVPLAPELQEQFIDDDFVLLALTILESDAARVIEAAFLKRKITVYGDKISLFAISTLLDAFLFREKLNIITIEDYQTNKRTTSYDILLSSVPIETETEILNLRDMKSSTVGRTLYLEQIDFTIEDLGEYILRVREELRRIREEANKLFKLLVDNNETEAFEQYKQRRKQFKKNLWKLIEEKYVVKYGWLTPELKKLSLWRENKLKSTRDLDMGFGVYDFTTHTRGNIPSDKKRLDERIIISLRTMSDTPILFVIVIIAIIDFIYILFQLI